MQITIKSTRIIKEGNQAKSGQPYKWCSVMADDGSEKGTEYTTFDAGVLKHGAGTVIDIGDPKTKEGKLSFDKIVSVISEGAAPVPPPENGKNTGRYSMEAIELECKTRIQIEQIRGVSVEGQVALKELGEMMGTNPVLVPQELKDLWATTVEKKILAFSSDLKEQLARMPHVGDKPEVKPEAAGEGSEARTFANVGEFMSACKERGITRKQIVEHLGIKEADISKIDTQEAWMIIYADLIKPSEQIFEEGKAKTETAT